MTPNIILIVCDTLRRDVLQVYGGEAKTPHLNRLAKDSMVYDNAIAPSPWTFPSHVSLFTGLYPSQHGIHETKTVKVEQLQGKLKQLRAPRLPEQLQAEGYRTICISNNYMINRHAGFEYGFDVFEQVESSPWSKSKLVWQALELGTSPSEILMKLVTRGRFLDIAKYAAEFSRIKLEALRTNYPIDKGASVTNSMIKKMPLKDKFFLFINFWEMHEPYKHFSDKEFLEHIAGIKQIDKDKIELLKKEYIQEAEFLDSRLGDLFGILKERGLYDGSMIIITSDHGQEFNEHGYMYHGSLLHDEITRVPMIIKYPSSEKFEKKRGYQSLVNVPRLVDDILGGKDDGALTSKTAFAEVYANIEFMPESMKHVRKIIEKNYDVPRKAVFMDGYKLTVNGSSGRIEEFTKNGKEINPDSNKTVLKKLVQQLNKFKGKEKFRIPAT